MQENVHSTKKTNMIFTILFNLYFPLVLKYNTNYFFKILLKIKKLLPRAILDG